MAWVAVRLTGSRPAAWLAAAIFCLSPYFTEYHVEFQMLLAAPIPLMLYAWVRWLEDGRARHLAAVGAGLVLLGATTWYYAIVTSFGLSALTAGVLALCWRGWKWRRRIPALALAGLAVGAALAPFALPYLTVNRELQLTRTLDETAAHSANLVAWVTPAPRGWLVGFFPRHYFNAETWPFVGFTALALAAVSLVWFRRDLASRAARSLRRAGLVVGVLALGLLALSGAMLASGGHLTLGPVTVRPGMPALLGIAAPVVAGLLLRRGWVKRREDEARGLSEGDWVRLLLLLTGVSVLLSLGPVMRLGGLVLGAGPYAALYDLLLPLRAVRVAERFAVLGVAALALLASLGLRAILDHQRPARGRRRAVIGVVALALGIEYAVHPIATRPAQWDSRPVNAVLRADPEDVAVLEWPINLAAWDTDAMFWSLVHGKKVINGHSGFLLPLEVELARLLSIPTTPFPAPEAEALLRRIYPLRYLVVRLDFLDHPGLGPGWRRTWVVARDHTPPLLRFRGTHGDADLYEVVTLPERGRTLERWVSHGVLRTRPYLHLGAVPLVDEPDLDQWIDVTLNHRAAGRVPLGRTAAPLELAPPFLSAAPNVIELNYRYRRRPGVSDARYRIGTTGVLSPQDLRIVSDGRSGGHGGAGASIQMNGVEWASLRRGYNLLALDAEGRVLDATFFDTWLRGQASRMAQWIDRLPAGTIVAGGVHDESSSAADGGSRRGSGPARRRRRPPEAAPLVPRLRGREGGSSGYRAGERGSEPGRAPGGPDRSRPGGAGEPARVRAHRLPPDGRSRCPLTGQSATG